MEHKKKKEKDSLKEDSGESLVVAWCDNGFTDSLFTSSLATLLLHIDRNVPVKALGISQTIGNQIARQRMDAIKSFENLDCDWLLWVDSDIVLNQQAFDLLWQNKNAKTHPIVCGVYFISWEMNGTLPAPFPCVFNFGEHGNIPLHPLPENELVKIDSAGLGFCLMHKSVAKKLRKKYGNTTFQITVGDQHISEDISFFFKLKELGIPVHAHTGALVQHIKRFSFDPNYYALWWDIVAPMKERIEKEKLNKEKLEKKSLK